MARINLEDGLFSDGRFRVLIRLLGNNEDRAIGHVVRAWFLAQKYWFEGMKVIPLKIWQASDLQPLIDADLAEERDGGIYCRGAQEHFDWYHRMKEGASRGGKRSAEIRRKKSGSSIPHNASNKPKANRTLASDGVEVPPNPGLKSLPKAEASLPNALTPTLTLTTENIPPGSAVWSAYSGSYFARYGVAPVRNAKSNGQCSQLVKRLGIDAAIGVVKFYLTHQQAYYVAKAHGLGPCLSDAEALHTQMLNGQKITRGSASQADSAAGNLQAFENVARKWAAKEREDKNEQAQNFDAAGNDGGTIG